jgi:hypothetical protein
LGEFTLPLLHYNVASSLRGVKGERADVEEFMSGDVFIGTSNGAAIHMTNINPYPANVENIVNS